MILMLTTTYPATSAVEMGKAVVKNFQELPFPDYIKPLGIYNTVAENGIKGYAIIEIDKGKEDDAFKFINKRMVNYLSVPGIGFKEERLRTMEESLALVGL
jgi:hypothetical protein